MRAQSGGPLACLCLLSIFGFAADTNAAEISVQVRGLSARSGQLAYALFDHKNGFPSDKTKSLRRSFMPYAHDSNLDTFDFIISDVSSGSYALILFDDLNGNRFLDKNLLGIPLEPVGASNNPSYRFGPPRFDECLFELSEPLARVLIKVVD